MYTLIKRLIKNDHSNQNGNSNSNNENHNVNLNKSSNDLTNANGGDHFKRSTKSRMSLPIMQQQQDMMLRRQATHSMLQIQSRQSLANHFHPQQQQQQQQQHHHQQQQHLQQQQLHLQSLGHIYLQYGRETKRANLPNELTTLDTIKALFVCAFPNLLTMEYMSQMHVKIYIYNPKCNIFYELNDILDVKHESVLRIHQTNLVALPPPPPPPIQPPIPMQQAQQNHLQSHSSQSNLQYQHQQRQLNNPTPTSMRLTPIHQHHYNHDQSLGLPPPLPQVPPPPSNGIQQQQQQQQQLVPPPKPRRMIPVVNGINHYNNQPNVIYGMSTSTPLNGLH